MACYWVSENSGTSGWQELKEYAYSNTIRGVYRKTSPTFLWAWKPDSLKCDSETSHYSCKLKGVQGVKSRNTFRPSSSTVHTQTVCSPLVIQSSSYLYRASSSIYDACTGYRELCRLANHRRFTNEDVLRDSCKSEEKKSSSLLRGS